MLLELAIGDAYGAGFEYADQTHVATKNNMMYVRHPRHGIRPGCYTDDAQMSIAIAELIVNDEAWTPENVAFRFLQAFHRDKREGYAYGFYKFLLQTKTPKEFLKNIRPDSEKSGAAMRASIIGLYPVIDAVKERATIQAKVTHNTKGGIDSAIASALMAHYCRYNIGPKANLGEFLAKEVDPLFAVPWRGKVGALGIMSVRAAITALQRNDSMSSLLKDCIAFTGDVDTVATIALAAGSVSKEIEQDLPATLLQGLEDGKYGRKYLIALDTELKNRY